MFAEMDVAHSDRLPWEQDGDSVVLWTVIWNFASAILGGFIGGIVTAYSIGRWRGEMEQRVLSLQEWRFQVDQRLVRGSDQLITIPVVESKIEEVNRIIELVREDIRDGLTGVQRQIEHQQEMFVLRGECDRQHRRGSKP